MRVINSKIVPATNGIACKLTSPELQNRKETALANLQMQTIERKELHNGYAFKFTDLGDCS